MFATLYLIETNQESPIYERLSHSPDLFTDDELRWLMRMYEGRKPKGRNAQIPAKAYLIWEKRHPSPTGKEHA